MVRLPVSEATKVGAMLMPDLCGTFCGVIYSGLLPGPAEKVSVVSTAITPLLG
jgi:glycine/serine hydroxymethyltransferase